MRLGINGFGRIGRTVYRAAASRGINIVHINDLCPGEALAHLLQYDSVHGRLEGVKADERELSYKEQRSTLSQHRDPKAIPWGELGVDLVLECTGLFTKRAGFEGHLQAGGGAPRVLISAPAQGEDLTVVYGVNSAQLGPEHRAVSNGSCTTNCLAPVAKVIQESLGIVAGSMTTVHSYTSDQQILDGPHRDLRRARAGALSMVPTSTGAAKAIGLVLPELKGKLDGLAVRVPTPNVSLVDVTFQVGRETSKDEVNKLLRGAADGPLKGVLGYSEAPLVSADYNGTSWSSCVDAGLTTVTQGRLVKVLSWYDNETGFSQRMLDVAELMYRVSQ